MANPIRNREPGSVLAVLSGDPQFLGTIVATTTTNNHTTAVAFNDTGDGLKSKCLLIQADSACYILTGTANTAAVTTANGVKIGQDERVIIYMAKDSGWLACLAVSGTTNLKVWELI